MARTQARVKCSIWQEDEWRDLTPSAQWLYLAILSQSKLSLAGCIDYMPRRWARWADGLTEVDVEAAVAELAEAGYVVADRRTEEIVVRAFVKHDINPTNAKVRAGLWSAWSAIESQRLRSVVAANLPDVLLEDAPAEVRDAAEHHQEQVDEQVTVQVNEQVDGHASPPLPTPPPPPPAAASADDRAARLRAACAVLADRHMERHPSHSNPRRHREAIVAGKVSDHTDVGYRLIAESPTISPDQLADLLEPPPPPKPAEVNPSSHLQRVEVTEVATKEQMKANAEEIRRLKAERHAGKASA